LDEVWKYKLILVETPDSQETSLALETYRTACCNGRGAVMLCVARGKVSEGIDFDHHYGRTVLCIGIFFILNRPCSLILIYHSCRCPISVYRVQDTESKVGILARKLPHQGK
jgi:hypothetical protein